MKWYIAGPMTGYKDLNFPAFAKATQDLRFRGHEVISPAEINPDPNADWTECMLEDIKQLSTCDAILMLKGWKDSHGASIEWHTAQRLKLHIEYEESD